MPGVPCVAEEPLSIEVIGCRPPRVRLRVPWEDTHFFWRGLWTSSNAEVIDLRSVRGTGLRESEFPDGLVSQYHTVTC